MDSSALFQYFNDNLFSLALFCFTLCLSCSGTSFDYPDAIACRAAIPWVGSTCFMANSSWAVDKVLQAAKEDVKVIMDSFASRILAKNSINSSDAVYIYIHGMVLPSKPAGRLLI